MALQTTSRLEYLIPTYSTLALFILKLDVTTWSKPIRVIDN